MDSSKDEKPKAWIHMNQSEKFLKGVFPPSHARVEKVGDTYIGVITRTLYLGKQSFPINLYYHTSEFSALIKPARGLSFIFWNKIRKDSTEPRRQSEKGYLQMIGPFAQSRAPIAYLDLQNVSKENYYILWSSTLKNHRNKWLRNIENGEILVAEVVLQDFIAEYKKSDIKKSLKSFYLKQMLDFKNAYAQDMTTYLIKDSAGKVLAGTCILDDRETKQCIYQYAFSHKSPKYKYIGVGIIDFCIRHTLDKSFSFLNLTATWDKYQPKSWRGLTSFKMQFNPTVSDCRFAYFKILLKIK